MRAHPVALAVADEAWPADRQRLREIPQNPRPLKGFHNWVNGFHLFWDYLATVPPRMARWTAGLRRPSPDFRSVEFSSRDGTRLSGWLGVAGADGAGKRAGGEHRDALILLPGLYTSKENYRIRARSERILRSWGFHILTLDLRGVGLSERTFSTPGWKEAEDIEAAVAFLRREANVRRVHLYAESLAAAAAILAAGRAAQRGERLLDGRIVSMSPFADAAAIVELYAAPQPERTALGKDFVAVQRFFNLLLRLGGYRGGRFDRYVADGARHYGVPLADALARSSPSGVVADVNVPLLVVHSEDDGLVPVGQARELARRASGNPHVDVWVLPWGYHCLYEMGDAEWYWRVLGTAFGAPTDRG